jgi:hypothetical protein
MNIRSQIFGGERPVEEPLLRGKAPKGVSDALDSIEVRRAESRRGNQRGCDRHRLTGEQVRLTRDGRTYDVELVNLSGGGAMVAGKVWARLWDKVDLHLSDGYAMECAVRWMKDGRLGLEFAHETRLGCSDDEEAELLREVIARSFPDAQFEDSPTPENESCARDSGDQRRERRHPLIWSGTLCHDFQSTTVRLRNISSAGAQIECDDPPVVGSEPMLDLGDAGSVFAKVSWVVGNHAGLEFQDPFDMALLAKSSPELAPQSWKPDYLDCEVADDSPWAEEWGRMSLSELRDGIEGPLKR